MHDVRRRLFFITVILIAIGVVMIYSASAVFAYEKLNDSAYYLKRHLFYLIIGAILSWIVLQKDYNCLKKYSKLLILASFFLLFLVLIPGVSLAVGGAKRWLRFGFFNFQPSELAKFSLLIYICDFLVRKKAVIRNSFYRFLPLIIVTLLFAGTVLIQPDLGTAFLFVAILFVYMIVFGVGIKYITSLILLSLPALWFLIFRVPYRKRRILAFLNPWADPRGTGFQIVQSLIAFGSGGILGVGLGHSRQKLLYLPAAHTDFIFSILGEELGFLGSISVVVLFTLFFWEAFKIPFRVKDEFGQLLSLGIIFILGLETLINISVSVGVLPTKGLPLPFISYGGSALMFNMIYVALLLNIARDKNI